MTAAAIVATLVVGLALDQGIDLWGQVITSVAVWALFLFLATRAPVRERTALFICIAYATAGELFLSLVWGLYSYRLENVPLFVPPGHALLFMLGMIVARHMKDSVAWIVPAVTAPYLAFAAYAGVDTFGLLLFAFFALCLLSGEARKLYATMFGLSMLLEIYGVWLGNWRWSYVVPHLNLTSTNPPATAGAFYCLLDFLVVLTLARLDRRAGQPASIAASDQAIRG
ncbi:MAG TPA: hypothetical protein VMK05_04805 [Burkholderiales bacterium]|nr:hypothetical protein [Burkholderiales bacterium]